MSGLLADLEEESPENVVFLTAAVLVVAVRAILHVRRVSSCWEPVVAIAGSRKTKRGSGKKFKV